MPASRLGKMDWSSVYLIQHRPGTEMLLYADVAGVEPGRPAATLSSPVEIAQTLERARNDARFAVLLDFRVDLRKLRHTRDGSTALLSFGLGGGRIATVQVPAELLQSIRTFRQNATAAASAPAWKPGRGRKAALIA